MSAQEHCSLVRYSSSSSYNYNYNYIYIYIQCNNYLNITQPDHLQAPADIYRFQSSFRVYLQVTTVCSNRPKQSLPALQLEIQEQLLN